MKIMRRGGVYMALLYRRGPIKFRFFKNLLQERMDQRAMGRVGRVMGKVVSTLWCIIHPPLQEGVQYMKHMYLPYYIAASSYAGGAES